MIKRIGIIGSGAIGSVVGGFLTKAGRDVTLIDQWPEHVETMREEGLRISMPDEDLHVPVRAYHLCDVCTLNQTFDLVLLVSKAYDTRWLSEFIKPYLAPDGLLVGVQNAMMQDEIAAVVGEDRTIGCVVELSSEIFTPGVVQRNTPPQKTWFGLGSLDRKMDARLWWTHMASLGINGASLVVLAVLAARFGKDAVVPPSRCWALAAG